MKLDAKAFDRFLHSADHFHKKNGVWYASSIQQVSYPHEVHNVIVQFEDDSYWFRHRNNCIVSLVKRFSDKELFFDIGGGNGVVSKALEDAGISSVMVDPGKEGVKNSKQRKLPRILCATADDLLSLEGQIPAMGAFDVIEHIEDDQAFIAQAGKLLCREGLFFITVPAYPFLWSEDDVFAGHFRRYRLKTMIKLLEKNNFDIVYASYLFSVLILAVLIFRTLRPKFGFRKKNKINEADYKQKNGITGRLLNTVWKWELGRIRQLRSIPFGTSCLIVAKKK